MFTLWFIFFIVLSYLMTYILRGITSPLVVMISKVSSVQLTTEEYNVKYIPQMYTSSPSHNFRCLWCPQWKVSTSVQVLIFVIFFCRNAYSSICKLFFHTCVQRIASIYCNQIRIKCNWIILLQKFNFV